MTIRGFFRECRKKKKLALIGYLPAGYPTPADFLEHINQAALAGLGCIEIGIPTNNTELDGKVISEAMAQVVKQGISVEMAVTLAGQALSSDKIPGIGMLYYSALNDIGETSFFSLLRQHGVEGILVPDIPLQQWDSYVVSALSFGLTPIGFITAGMNIEAVRKVASSAEGFLYLQAYPGTTGQRIVINSSIVSRVKRIKEIAAERHLPVAVGFGIRSNDDASIIRNIGADGIIIGTALVEASARGSANVADLISGISEAISGTDER